MPSHRLTERHLHVQIRRSASTFLFFVAADAYSRPFCEFFCWANVNRSIFTTEPNKDNIIQQLFWADKFRMAVYFSQFFSRHLFGHFKPRSSWRKWSIRSQIVLCDVLNVKFLSRRSCLAAARQSLSHTLTVLAHLVCCCCAVNRCWFFGN